MTAGLPLLLTTLGALSAATPTVRVAVIAGVNDGGPEREVLRWAHRDAEAVAGVMGTLGGVAAGDRLVLIEPDRAALDATLAVAEARLAMAPAGARSELLFYFSGHADQVGLLLGAERYPFRDLRARLDAIDVDLRLVVVDACASGALIAGRGDRAKGGIETAPFVAEGDLVGHAYLTSAAADEVAQESDQLEASYFTHDLITGLRGAADRDRDRTVTLTEAYRYAFDATLARTQRTRAPQHPVWDIALTGAGDVVLTRLDRPSARLVFGAALSGRFFIRDPRQVLVAEIDKERDETLELTLPAGAWQVSTEEDGRLLKLSRELEAHARIAVARADFRDAGPVLEGRPRGEAPIRLRLSLVPLVGFEGLGDDVVVHGVSLAFIGDRILALKGAQLATVFNAAGEVTGTQIGLVNIGGHVRGAQIGVVNVADRLEGASIGLFPWVGGPDGLHHLELYGGSHHPLAIGWRVGARWLHTAVALSTDGSDCDLAIATGTEIDLHPVSLGFDLGTRLSAPRCDVARLGSKTSVALRALFGVRLTPAFGLFAGAAASVDTDESDAVKPEVFGGIRLFR